ncbi:hemicentin-1-like isoform X3 [Acropora palmata]|uniref:hemicentin-1-like isoform X3 n=1 Tax=Acropora palmata TaxID=6131 RepID=UPI003DA0B138
MSFVSCLMPFAIFVFCPETETATTALVLRPANPSYAVEGTNFTLKWNYALDGSLSAVQFSNVTGTGDDPIGSRVGPGTINSKRKYEARFRAQAESTRAELTILAVQLSDEATYKLSVVSSQATFIWDSVRVIVHSPPSNIITSSDQKIKAPALLTLNCATDGKPKPRITWTRLSDNTVITMPLFIISGRNEESYRCTADNGVGKPLSKDVFVDIQVPVRPMVEFTSKVFVGHKQTALLVREVEGNPTPIISWSPCHRKNVCDKQYLNISKVQTARANYDCTARNALNLESATTVFFIGGKNVFLRLSLSGECDHKDSVWKVLQKELSTIFTNYYTQNYSGADLIDVRCGSLIFDVVLKFSIEVSEHATISVIQNATVNEKLGELNVNVSYIIGIPPVKQTTTAALTTTTPNLDVPPMVKLPSKVFVGREQSASLNCEVEGNPTPTISWSPCDVENLLCDKQILNICKVQSARANYSCAARNYLGIATATTVLVIGGKDVYLRLSVSAECDCKDSLWKKLQEELVKIFAKTQRYLRAQLIEVSFLRCESLIFDAVLMFSTEVAEDDTISSIQNAIVDGKLGELSVNVSYIIGIPPVEQTTTAAPTSSTPKSDRLFQILVERDYSSSTAFGASFGVGVLVAVIAVVV